jgi:hypothetical protein
MKRVNFYYVQFGVRGMPGDPLFRYTVDVMIEGQVNGGQVMELIKRICVEVVYRDHKVTIDPNNIVFQLLALIHTEDVITPR